MNAIDKRWTENETDAVYRELHRLQTENKKANLVVNQTDLLLKAQQVLPSDRHHAFRFSSSASQEMKKFGLWLKAKTPKAKKHYRARQSLTPATNGANTSLVLLVPHGFQLPPAGSGMVLKLVEV